MANALKRIDDWTEEAYLSEENVQFQRHEFVAGFVYAMAGASEGHADIKLNIAAWIKARVPAGCRVFDGDLKLRLQVANEARFYYPDVFVSCGPRDRTQQYRNDATLVVEILSPSTERVDRKEKMEGYQCVPSLEEYIIVAQATTQVTVFRRRTGWKAEYYSVGESIDLASLTQSIPVAVIHEDMPL